MIASKAYFVCGTDTDVGKTTVCAGLLRNMPDVHMIKAIQTGEGLIDQGVYTKAFQSVKAKTLFHLSFAASPHLAAQREKRMLNYEEVKRQVKKEVDANALTIVEGSGGIMTPITPTKSFCDLMTDLAYPVVLVVKNMLGAINHALLTVNMLRQRGIPVYGFIFTTPEKIKTEDERVILEDNINIIVSITKVPVIADIPFIPDLGKNPESWSVLSSYLKEAATSLLQPLTLDTKTELIAFDQQHVWHPYEQAQSALPKPLVTKAKGTKMTLSNGQVVTDGISSWWTAIHGYSHPELVAAVQSQSVQMSHIMFGGLTHEPAIRLTQKLLSIVPPELAHVFYADSGSVAIEIAMKMARQYWRGKQQPAKTKFISFKGGYHGDTAGAMSIGDPDGVIHGQEDNASQKNIFAARPVSAFGASFDASSVVALRELVMLHHHECAAMVIEPIVQAAGGMWFYHPDYLKTLRQLCDEFNLLLIVDEIAVGFGRTGKLFASEWAGITPDIMCIGKGLTGGMLTLSATLTTEKVAEGIAESGQPFMHGPTYMGNALACHVACTSIDLLLKNNWQNQVKRIEKQLWEGLLACKFFNVVKDIRVLGAIGVVELSQPVNAKRLQQYFIEQGVWIRPFGQMIYLMPSYIATDEDIALLSKAIFKAIEEGVWA